MKLLNKVGLGLVVAATGAQAKFVYPDCNVEPLASNPICDKSLSRAERAAGLVEAMNVQEKLGNIIRSAKGAPRLGLPNYNYWNEALHGVAYAPNLTFGSEAPFNAATQFPMPVLMAAAFDDDLIEEIGNIIGTESRAWGNYGYSGIDYWTPNVNPYKDPRWGRGSETPGEDAVRVSRYAKAMVEGLEGYKDERRIIATCKHYVGNDFEDWNGFTRHDFNAIISMQDLAEYYILPFQQCTRDSKCGSIMCAYNAVNGVPSCASDYLQNTVLRDHWKWTDTNNYITSDCEAVLDVSANHEYNKTNAEGTAECFIKGMDTSCEYTSSSDIPGAWEQGLLKEDVVDRALQRLYEGLIQAGYFEGANAEYASLGWEDVNTPEAQALALQSAVDGIVLLKNDGTLPLELKKGADIAMIGFWAEDEEMIIGDYSGRPPYRHSPLWAAEQMGFNVYHAGGPLLQDNCTNDNWTAPALEAARKADYIFYFGGLDTSAAGEEQDRYSLEWPRAQRALLKTLTKLDKPLVVVQLGDQLDNTKLLDNDDINAILWTSWPGQEGGPAIMKLITGEESPAGRLPVTQYPGEYVDQIPVTSMDLRPTSEHPGRTYRWYEKAVQPFGFGLHYTTFSTSFKKFPKEFNIQSLLSECHADFPDTCSFPPLSVRVKNTGKRTSDYVALAFLGGEFGPAPYPLKTLASYTRLKGIKPGRTAAKELKWSLGEIARHDEEGNTVLYPGEYTVLLDEPTRTELKFKLTGKAEVLQKWPQPPPNESPDQDFDN
ncbi:glycoside hydrolase [Sarocladium strictum]